MTPTSPSPIPRWLRPVLGAALALALAGASSLLFRPLDPPTPPAPSDRGSSPKAPATDPPAPEAPATDRPTTTATNRTARPKPPSSAPPRALSSPERATLTPEAAAVASQAPEREPDPEPAPDVDASAVSETADAPAIRGVWPTDPEGIRSAIREAMPDLRECYRAWVQANPELEGVTRASFTITADPQGAEGHVSEVHLQESTLAQPFLEGCVLNVLAALRFEAPPDGPVKVTYPFILHADR